MDRWENSALHRSTTKTEWLLPRCLLSDLASQSGHSRGRLSGYCPSHSPMSLSCWEHSPWGHRHAKPNSIQQIRSSLAVFFGVHRCEQRCSAAEGQEQEQGRLRLCLPANEVLFVHDRSQNGGPL